MIRGVLHVGSVPSVDIKVDLTPVDFVAEGIVHLSQKPECLGREFNLLNREPLHLQMMAEWIARRSWC